MDLPVKQLKLTDIEIDKDIAMNLLDLPYEILLKIFSYIPEQLKISLTCKKFYELSLEKSYQLSFRVENESDTSGMQADSETVSSILSTRRKISKFSWNSYWNNPQFENVFGKISECHGGNINGLYMSSRCVPISFTFADISSLNFMENLKILDLFNSNIREIELPDEFQLNLLNLRELWLYKSESWLPVLDRLPDNVLQKVIFNNVEEHETWLPCEFYYFSNQKSIEEIIFISSDIQIIAIDELRPKSLTYSCRVDGEEMDHPEMTMAGQDQMKFFSTNYSGCQRTLEYLCIYMELLEELELNSTKVPDINPIQDFSPLEKLKKLKKFKSGVPLNQNRLTLKSKSLEEICFNITADDVDSHFHEFSANCPNLKKIIWPLAPLRVFNEILPNFPNLESFETKSSLDDYEFMEGFELKNLKHLKVRFIKNTENILKFFANCKKLESIKMILSEFDAEFLKELTRLVPTLKSLCLTVKHQSYIDIEAMKEIIKVLDSFHCVFSFEEESVQEMKKTFPSSKFEINIFYTILTIRKDGCENICCTGLRQHMEMFREILELQKNN